MFPRAVHSLFVYAAVVVATARKHGPLQYSLLSHGTDIGGLGKWNKADILPDLRGQSPEAGKFNSAAETFNALSIDAFTTLRHHAYPRHSVRVKKSKFCDGTVESVSLHALNALNQL